MILTTAADSRRGAAPARDWFPAIEIWSLVAIFTLYALAAWQQGESAADFANRTGPVFLMAALGFGAWRMARRNPAALWTPLFWFRVTATVYYGLGQLAPFIADESALAHMRALYPFTHAETLKLNMIVTLGLVCILAGSGAYQWLFPSSAPRSAAMEGLRNKDGLLASGLAFAAVGSAFKYLVLLPQQLGFLTITVPGALGALASCSYVGVFLLIAWTANHARYAWPALLAFLGFELFTALMTFSKLQVFLTVLMAGLGYLTLGVTARRVSLLIAAVSAALVVLQPLVSYARLQQIMHLGSMSAPASMEQRMGYLASYFDRAANPGSIADPHTTLSRLSFVNAGTFVIAQHDAGAPGNSYRYALYAFVPRVIWPDKPETTEIGEDLSRLATGNEGQNSISAGWFAEAYWNLGWAGVPMLMLPVGVLFAMLSRYNAAVLRRGQWLSLPVVFLGLHMGTRVDGHLSTDVIGTMPILIAYLGCVTLIRMLLPVSASATPRPRKRVMRW